MIKKGTQSGPKQSTSYVPSLSSAPPAKSPVQSPVPKPLPISPRTWRQVKKIADYLLLAVVIGGLGWSATSAVTTVRQNTRNRAVVSVHLGTPAVELPGFATASFPAQAATRTQEVAITIANDSPDGVFVSSAELSGPYLAGAVALMLPNNGYITTGLASQAVGEVTIDCAQTAGLVDGIRSGALSTTQAPTLLKVTLTDANKQRHVFTLTVDTTAYAIQGQVCAA
jgi:hypothetical protein